MYAQAVVFPWHRIQTFALFLIFLVSRVHGYAAPPSPRILETLLKQAETRLARSPDYRSQSPGKRYMDLLEFIEGAGIEIPRSAKSRIATPGELADLLLGDQEPSDQRAIVSRLKSRLTSPDGGGEPSAAETADPEPDPPARGADPEESPAPAFSVEQAPATELPPRPDASSGTDYVLGPMDSFEVLFMDREIAPGGKTNESFSFSINLAGMVVMPLLGIERAAGFTPAELQTRLVARYRKYIQNPRLTVFVKSYASKKVFVMGQGGAAKVVNLTGVRTTLFEVLTQNGGVADGDPHHILVYRGNKKIVVDFQKHLDDPAIAGEFVMMPGDRVIIPKPTQKVTILGGVQKAGEYPFTDGMSVLKLVALAGSFSDDSRRDRIRVIRQPPRGKARTQPVPVTIKVDATRILRGKDLDVPLRAQDTVYVDEW